MPGSITRDDAIALLCDADLTNLSTDERLEQLDIMMVERWDSDPVWATLPADVREEFDRQDDIEHPDDPRYDPVLKLWLRQRYSGARGAFLVQLLRKIGHECQQVTGDPDALIASPCCGGCTLS